MTEMAMGQKPVPPVNIPIPTKIDENGWCTYPKMGPLVLTHNQNRLDPKTLHAQRAIALNFCPKGPGTWSAPETRAPVHPELLLCFLSFWGGSTGSLWRNCPSFIRTLRGSENYLAARVARLRVSQRKTHPGEMGFPRGIRQFPG